MSAVIDQDLTPEQRALLSGAAAIDGQVAPAITHDENGQPIAQEQDQQLAAVDAKQRNVELLTLGLTLLQPVAPFLAECYPPPMVDAIASAFTAVEIKRGWNVQQFMSEEFVLAVVAVPPTIKAVQMGRAYIAAMKAQAEAASQPNQDTMRTVAVDGHQ